VANRLEVNADYLGRVFKNVTRTNIGQFLIDRRLREARKLLQESDLNVNQIAQAAGFADPGYFRRLFRKHFDMKPADFRKLYFRVHINVR
jgi:AraC-like DNA-binding protein